MEITRVSWILGGRDHTGEWDVRWRRSERLVAYQMEEIIRVSGITYVWGMSLS